MVLCCQLVQLLYKGLAGVINLCPRLVLRLLSLCFKFLSKSFLNIGFLLAVSALAVLRLYAG